MHDRPTDEELFAAHVRGDSAAFGEIVRRWTPTLRGLMHAGGVPDPAVDELVQESFLLLHRSAPDFRHGEPLRPWIVTIALNLRRERARRFLRRERLGPPPLEPSPAPDPAETVEAASRARAVRTALGQLAPPQREVLELHWFVGLSFAEIAAALGASVPAVKVRAHRGYERLRILLGGQR